MKKKLPRLVIISIFIAVGVISFTKTSFGSDQINLPDALPQFANVSEEAGINTAVESWGAGWGDYNNDGFLDLIDYCHDFRIPELFRNNGDGTFTDVVSVTPLYIINDRHNTAWADYDNDGDQDLYVGIGGQAGTGTHLKELFNIEDGVLTDVASIAGISDGEARNRAASWADYDRDGYLDLFVANHERVGLANRLWHNNGDGTFTDKATEAGVADNIGIKFGNFIDYDRDGWPDIFVMGISQNLLYHNMRDGTFEDIAVGSEFAKGAFDTYSWGDYDNDGLADIFMVSSIDVPIDYVSSSGMEGKFSGLAIKDQDGLDFITDSEALSLEVELLGPDACRTTDCIFIGAGGVHPVAVPFTVGIEAYGTPSYTPGTSLGYYIWRDNGTYQWHIRMSTSEEFKYAGYITSTAVITNLVPIDIETEIPVGYTRLWHNDGEGQFSRADEAAGLSLAGNFRTTNWIDFDNDGYLDLFIIDQGNLVEGNLPDRLFHNNGDGTFTDVATVVGVTGTTLGEGSVSTWADYDNDGFLDLFTQNGNNTGSWLNFPHGPNELFHNQGNSNHWIQLKLIGQQSNTSGLGAVVSLSAGGKNQILTMDDGISAYNQYGNPLHFGLGNMTTIDRIQISWPSGVRQLLSNIAVDQILTIIEQQSPRTWLPFITR